jgi:hypothetical protein
MRRIAILTALSVLAAVASLGQTPYPGTPPAIGGYYSTDGTGITWDALKAAAGTAPYSGTPPAGGLYYSSTGTQAGPWYPCTLALCFSGGGGGITLTTTGTSGPATLVGSTLNIPVYSGSSGCATTGCTFTGLVTFAASTTGGPSFNIPSGTAPTSPVQGDQFAISGYDCYYNGTQQICGVGVNPAASSLILGQPVIGTGSHTMAPTVNYFDVGVQAGADWCAKTTAANTAAGNNGYIWGSNVTASQACGTNPFTGLSNGEHPLRTKLPCQPISTAVPWVAPGFDIVLTGCGQEGNSILQASGSYTPNGTVSVTAWSITSDVATFTATNTLTAGQFVTLAAFGTSTFFNGQTCVVISTGLSTSQFECAIIHAGGSATEAGTGTIATPILSFGAPGVNSFGDRCEDWRISSALHNPGTVMLFNGSQEYSGPRRCVMVGNNDSTPTGDALVLNGANNITVEDNSIGEAGNNNAINFLLAGGGNALAIRNTCNNSGFVVGNACLYFSPTQFQTTNTFIAQHSEGFRYGAYIGANHGVTGVHIDSSGTAPTDVVHIDSGASPGGVQILGINDEGTSTNLVSDCSFSPCRNLVSSLYGFGSHQALGLYSNATFALTGLNYQFNTYSSAHTMTVNETGAYCTGTTTISINHLLTGQFYAFIYNSGAGTCTVQADSGTINGVSSIAITAGQAVSACVADGTNVECGGVPPAAGTITAIQNGGVTITPTAGAVNLVAGSNVTLTTSTNSVTIAASATAATAWSAITAGPNTQTSPFSTTAPWTLSAAGAASTPGMTISGAPFTGGSGTTTFPQFYINSGAARTNFNTAGTVFGINAPSGFTGTLIDTGVNGGTSSVFSVSSAGKISNTGGIGANVGSNSFQVSSAASGGVSISTSTAADVPLIVNNSNASPSGDIQDWQGNSIKVASIGPTGSIAGNNSITLGVNGGTGGSVVLNGGTSGSATLNTSATGVLALPSGTTATSMVLTTPALGTPASGVLTNATGYPTIHTANFSFGTPGGSAISTGILGYQSIPIGCTITGWYIAVDAGTATVKTLKVAAGTAIPTLGSNSISTSGVSISTGTVIQSTTVTDFTTTTVTANDIIAADLITTSGVGYIQFQLKLACTQ